MRHLNYVLSLLVLTSCATPPRVQEQYASRVVEINRLADSHLFKDQPYVLETLHTPEQLKAFGEANCPQGTSKPECILFVKRAAMARLSLVYFAAGEDVNTVCTAYPDRCRDYLAVEKVARESHNNGIERIRQYDLQNIDQWQKAAAEQEYQNDMRNAVMLQSLGTQIQRDNTPMICNSSGLAGNVTTVCH